jgi:2-amino-4-hydroxy-6-hydroxymethyldihydropteridine diphosphokinase
MVDAYVGLASNLDPDRHLREAVEHLERRFGPVQCSGIYESPAHGGDGANYLNGAARFATALGCEATRAALRDIEASAGRDRTPGSAISLDLDLLLYGSRVDPAARVPRADILQQAFVLAPLVELAGQLPHPVTGEPLMAAWRALAARQAVPLRLGGVRVPR